jgi:hypothetical protein
MSDPLAVSDAAEAVARDHRRVDAEVARLRSANDLARLVTVLEELDRVLVAHFAHEESPGGIYEVMGVANPELRTPLGDLVAEHYTLLTDIRTLAGRGREILQLHHVELLAEARALADRLAAHESREDAIAAAEDGLPTRGQERRG